MPNVGTRHDSFSSSSSTEVRPKRSYEIELGDETVGAEGVRYEVAGVVRPSPSMLLLPIELLQLSCGFALESVLTPLIEFPQGWLPTMGSDEDDEVIVSNGSSSTSAAVTVAAGAASGTSVGVRA